MGIIYQLFLTVIINTITGSVMYKLWCKSKDKMMKINADLIYPIFHFTCILYVFPFGYIIMQRVYRRGIQEPHSIWRLVISTTNILNIIVMVLVVWWFVIVCKRLVYQIKDYMRFQSVRKGNVPETDVRAEQMLKKICREMGIPYRKLSLYRNDLVNMPMIVCLHHPEILLPYGKEYTELELKVLMSHELSHFKHKDLWLKILCLYIKIIHCFNPMTKDLLEYATQWSEYMADVSAVNYLGYEHGANTYFDCILGLLSGKAEIPGQALYSTLGDSIKDIHDRIDFMKRYREAKKEGKKASGSIVAAFVAITSVISFLSGIAFAEIHNRIYKKTEDQMQEKIVETEEGITEYYLNFEKFKKDNPKIIYDKEEILNPFIYAVQIHWEVEPDTVYISNKFNIKKDTQLFLASLLESGIESYEMGIINENIGVVRYVDAEFLTSYVFDIDTTGDYSVFIKNCSKQNLNFRGSCTCLDGEISAD